MVISTSNVGMNALGYDILCAFYSQVWYIMSSGFTRDKDKLVFMLH